MKFLICGLGSIGQRHYKNLKHIGYDDIIVYRTGMGNKEFTQKFIDEFNPIVFTDLQRALSEKPDAVFISNPTALHIPIALIVAQAGRHLFIEKPLSHDLNGIYKLAAIAENKDLVVQIGYHFRFHPLLRKVQQWLNNGRIGRIISVNAEMGELVSKWHPWEDYHNSYACRKDLGGGVILTQSHELDYLYWLFGYAKKITATGGNKSILNINVEDTADINIVFENNITAQVHLDYLQNPPQRNLKIVGEQGDIVWNYFDRRAVLTSNRGVVTVESEPGNFERNIMYIDELLHFIDCIIYNKKPICDIWQGIDVLKMALEAKAQLGE